MARYKVVLAYDGTEFQGFQRQKLARTVQGVVEEALQRLSWTGDAILAAGRTDTGVHASGQVVAFDLVWDHTPEELLRALNANLPLDTAAVEVSLASPSFHPRYEAEWREYRYRIFCSPVRSPLRERYAWRVWPEVDLTRLCQVAQSLPGTHDFAAFGTPPKAGRSTVRTVLRAEWLAEAGGFVFEIAANAFLYHMVRRLVSVQVEIGQGKRPLEMLNEYLSGEQLTSVQGLAPPQGLALTQVCYSKKETK